MQHHDVIYSMRPTTHWYKTVTLGLSSVERTNWCDGYPRQPLILSGSHDRAVQGPCYNLSQASRIAWGAAVSYRHAGDDGTAKGS